VKNFQLVAAGGDGGEKSFVSNASNAAGNNSDNSNGNSNGSNSKSTKNKKNVLLQFGKTGKDSFSMDVRGPLTPLQGFLICLTALDVKLACE